MVAEDIKMLRKEGWLDEALALAKQLFAEEADNMDNRVELAWCYHDFLGILPRKFCLDNFKDLLLKIKELSLSGAERRFFNTLAAKISKNVRKIPNNSEGLYDVFQIIKDFPFPKGGGYTTLYQSFAFKCSKIYLNNFDFIAYWGFDNFRDEDYKPNPKKGKTSPSVIEKICFDHSKRLIEAFYFVSNSALVAERIKDFIPLLTALIPKFPPHRYLSYNRAELSLLVGISSKEIFKGFLPFLKFHQNDNKVWDFLSDLFTDDKDLSIACCCRAITLNEQDKAFLPNVRLKLVFLLLDTSAYQEAKTELDKYVDSAQKNEFKIPSDIVKMTHQDWYLNTTALENNAHLYKAYSKKAEVLLNMDIPEETLLITYVNEEKYILNFIHCEDEKRMGFFVYKGLINKPTIGDLIKVRFCRKGKRVGFTALSVRPDTDNTPCKFIKDFKGAFIKGKRSNTFGFVNGIFIETRFVSKYYLNINDEVSGRAILSWNPKRDKMSWRAFEINSSFSLLRYLKFKISKIKL